MPIPPRIIPRKPAEKAQEDSAASQKAPTTKRVAAGKEIPGHFITTLRVEDRPQGTSLMNPGVPGRLIIGLDPSVTNFGYIELTESLEILNPATIKPKNLTGMPRMRYLMEEVVEKRIVSRKHLWEIVVFREDYAYAAGSSSDAILKELGGILEYELFRHKIRLITIPISSAKKMVTGSGNSKKDVVMRDVYKNFGYDGDEHTCDALAVALTGVCLLNKDKVSGLTKQQKEALKSLDGYDLTPGY